MNSATSGSQELRNMIKSAYDLMMAGNYPEALKILEVLKDKGVPEAGMYLGYMFEEGLGVQKDSVKALRLYAISADAGLGAAALTTARLAEKRGDTKGAVKYFRIAALDDNPSALYALYRLSKRDNSEVSKVDGFQFLERAYAGGHMYAKRDMARFMLNGRYGVFSRLIAFPILIRGIIEMSFLLANDPKSDRLH